MTDDLFVNFKAMQVELPEVHIKKMINNFEKATNNLAYLDIIADRKSSFSIYNRGEFSFSMLLKSNYLGHYSFRVLDFSYGVSIYPVTFNVEGGIASELGIKESENFSEEYIHVCIDENSVMELLRRIFSSPKFTKSVSGLMLLAERSVEKTKNFNRGPSM